jgi:hypothetical protein
MMVLSFIGRFRDLMTALRLLLLLVDIQRDGM